MYPNKTNDQLPSGSYDGGLEIALYGAPQFDKWRETEEKIIRGQDKARECKRGQVSVITLGGEDVVVSPVARKTVGVTPYPYLLEWGGYDIKICPDWESLPELGNVRVRYGAIPMLEYGVDDAHRRLVDWLDKIGFTTKREKLSRADLNVLLFEPVTDFKPLIDKGWYVTQAKKRGEWGTMKNIESYLIGNRASTCMRMYDKLAELQNDWGSRKTQLTIERHIGWDVIASGSPITRIEFSIGRPFMNKYGIYSLADFRAMERDIVDVHTWQWFRFLAESKVRGHENAAPLHPHWAKVRSEFLRCFDGSSVSLTKVEKNVSPDVRRLESQYWGLQKKILALKYGRMASVEEARQVAALYARASVDKKYVEDVNNIVASYEIRNDCKLGDESVEMIGFDGQLVSFHDRR